MIIYICIHTYVCVYLRLLLLVPESMPPLAATPVRRACLRTRVMKHPVAHSARYLRGKGCEEKHSNATAHHHVVKPPATASTAV